MEGVAEVKRSNAAERAWKFAKRNKGRIAFVAVSAVAVVLGAKNVELSRTLKNTRGVVFDLCAEREELYSLAEEMIARISFLEDLCALKDKGAKALASENLRLGGSLGGQCLADLRYAQQQAMV